MLDIILAVGPLVRVVTVQPGDQQPLRPVTALDKRGADVPSEHRRTVIAAIVTAAFQVPAVLAKPVPESGPAGWGQRVSADADHAPAAVGADLALLEEEVHTVTRPVLRAGAVTQQARAADAPRQLI